MCGLVVTIRRGGPVDPARLAAALDAVRHRGPDACGAEVVSLPSAEVGLGHARLAIQDLDRRSDQPFASGRHRLAYNGEIYDHRVLAAGLPLATTGDTEPLLRLLMRDGVEALRAANGMWAFAWLDEERARLTAARDRYGKKPLFYALEDDAFHLASEPGALASLLARPLAMRAEALDAFTADGWLFPRPDGATHLDGIREVRPGHALTLDIEHWTLDERKVFDLPGLESPLPDRDLGAAALAATLADAVEARLISDRTVGLFLSGGVDSSLILSVLAHRGLTGNVVCITGDAGRSDDARYAEACIARLGIEAMRVPLPYDGLGFEGFLGVCRAQAKPFPLIGNVLGMPALYRAAADRDIRVVLDGTGADEIFGGYWRRYAGIARRDAEAAGDQAWLASLDAPKAGLPEREGLGQADMAWLKADARAALSATAAHDPLIGFGGSLAEALALDSAAGRMQEWLWQNDRNAMAFGVENRSPFLDWRLAAWARTPYRAKFGEGFNKRELRALFPRFVSLPTAERRDKQGFRWAYGQFFRANLEAVAALIAGSAMAGRYVERDRFADALRAGAMPLDSPLLHRLTVAAGLEATGLSLSAAAAAQHP